jgi:N-acetylmuramoyl-L-alanine amidase
MKAADSLMGTQPKGPVGRGNHVVKQGECTESIAYEHGLFWKTIWNDPKNAELKQVRKNPSALLPGDKIHVREKEEKTHPGATGKRHRFRRKGIPSSLWIQVRNGAKPWANQPYRLVIDGKPYEGRTDADGWISRRMMPDVKNGKLTVGEGSETIEWVLDLRHLDPADEPSGVQGRLNNLGYDAGPVDGKMNEQTRAALARFQAGQGIEATGELDNTTIEKLKLAHGG